MSNNRQGRIVPALLRAAGAIRNPKHPIRPLLVLAAMIITVLAVSMPMAWVIANGQGPDWLYIDAVPTATPTAVPPTETPEPTPTIVPTQTAIPTRAVVPTPEPTHTHESALVEPPAAREPEPVRGGNLAALPLPANTTVIWGAASDGETWPYCFYWGPTHEVVMVDGCDEGNRVHELCHAHQHWAINGGAPLAPSDYDLESWYGTGEGQSFTAAVAGLSFPWTNSLNNGLEDFAWTCAYWYLDPVRLQQTGGQSRYSWAEENLP